MVLTEEATYVARRDNVSRLLGHGFPNLEETLDCAPNRATLVGYGMIEAGESNVHRIPLPPSLEHVTEPRALTVTVAWFSPVNPRHQAYRRAKLEVSALQNLERTAGVSRSSDQPSDKSATARNCFSYTVRRRQGSGICRRRACGISGPLSGASWRAGPEHSLWHCRNHRGG